MHAQAYELCGYVEFGSLSLLYRHDHYYYVALSHLMQSKMTALHHATVGGHVEVAIMLLEKGAATNLTDEVSLLCAYPLCIVILGLV